MEAFAAYFQPASLFCTRLPPDVLLLVAFELADIDPLGPPRHLPPFFLLCRYITDILTSHRKVLFARIHLAKFDTAAPSRRLRPSALTTSALAPTFVFFPNIHPSNFAPSSTTQYSINTQPESLTFFPMTQ